MPTLYITKYALSSGILEREQVDIDGRMAVVVEPGGLNRRGYYHGSDWHLTREAALADAEKRRVARIASLKKQIEKLEKLQLR